MKTLFLIILISFFVYSNHAQTKLDSAIAIWNNTSLSDTFRLRILDNELRNLTISFPRQKADSILNEFIIKTKEIGQSKYEANGMLYRGQLVIYNSGDLIEARVRLNKALSIYREIEFTYGISRTLSSIGKTYELDEPVLAMKFMKEAINESLSGNKMQSAIGCSFNLSDFYLKLGERMKALEVSSVAVKWAEELNDKTFMAWAYHGLSHVYLAQGDHTQGNEFHEKVLKIYEELGDQWGENSMLSHIAQSYMNQEKYKEALLYYEKALALSKA